MTDPVPSKERMPHWTCKTHGDFDARVAVGCPECVRQMREDIRRWENAHKILLSENDRLRKQVGELSVHAEKWVKRALGGATPEPCAIRWSDVQQPNDRCGYTHLTGETPFGRILITWKGWKESHDMALDESPWGCTGYVGSTVEDAKETVEREFSRRLALCRPSQPPGAEP